MSGAPAWTGAVLLLLHAVLVTVGAVLVSANRRPSAAIAWVLMIVFVPVLGLVAFAFVGHGRLPGPRRAKQRHVSAQLVDRTPGLAEVGHRDEWPGWLPGAVHMNRVLADLPMVGGNTAHLVEDYTGSITAMAADIDQARETVHVEFFILVLDEATAPFFEAMERAAGRGVAVRVLSDHVGSLLYPGRRATRDRLRAMGAEYRPMLPLKLWHGYWQRPDLRNHRKLLVVDGTVGWTGSQNLIEASYHKAKNHRRGLHWHELMVRLEGPVVRELDAVFVTDWYSETDDLLPLDTTPVVLGADHALLDAQVVPSGPGFDNDNNLKLFANLVHSARSRVSITSPYFVPDESLMLAMLTAGARGVDVELFVSEIGDQFFVHHAQRSYYEALLRAGVRIHLYRAPTVLHAKHMSVDDDVAVIGSSNMDIRSLSLHLEVSVLVHGRAFVDEVRAVEDGYRAASTELHLQQWVSRPRGQKVRDNLARLTSSLQ